ncbi:MAG: hypothetical protein ACR2FH_01390 [Caulobacteraceae bacterium]
MDRGPLSGALAFTGDELDRARAELAAKGIRELPWPFASAISVVSDADGTNRARYDAYCGAFLALGLDFGDSTFLRWSYNNALRGTESGFFSRHFSLGLNEPAETFERTRTFNENLVEYHLGNIDHFHSFLSTGPKAVMVRVPPGAASEAEIDLPPMPTQGLWRAADLDVMGVLAVGGSPRAVTLRRSSGETTRFENPTPATPAGEHARTLFLNSPSAEDERPVLSFVDVASILVHGAEGVNYIVLLSAHGPLLIDRIEYLRSFNVEMNLITEHSRLHFRNPTGGRADDEQLKPRLDDPDCILAVCGRYEDEDGAVFSTDSDDPDSSVRVLPELFDLGLRFLTVSAAEGAVGFEPLALISPTPTRAGGGGYWARRCLPNERDPPPGKVWDGTRTRMETFATRLERVLAHTETRGGFAWPIYTHLGGMDADSQGARGQTPNPEPYLRPDVLEALQDRVLGITGAGPRIWFVRPSVLYDYALMLRSLAPFVERSANHVAITSWHDAVLDRVLPCSPAQLYGLTFFVEDSASATVSLNGRPLETLVRNPADETGRQSVTVAECEIRYPLFHRLDPAAGDGARLSGTWRWADGVGRIDGRLMVELGGWTPVGAQLFALSTRGRIGVTLETKTGGRFFFGDPALAPEATTAVHVFAPSEDWRRRVAPFHGLRWSGRPGGPVPSDPLTAITLTGSGEVARAEFLRPRATTLGRATFCVAGHAPRFRPGQTVSLGAREATVDQRGAFCFRDVSPGVHALSSAGFVDRRGPAIEVVGDLANLVLDRPA